MEDNAMLIYVDLADRLPFPATPEDMHRLLEIERRAKRERGLTHRGINGYVYMGQESVTEYGRGLYV
jgi:hypothetical protein